MSGAIFVFDTIIISTYTKRITHIKTQKKNKQAAYEKLRKLIKRCERQVCAKANIPFLCVSS